MAWRGSISRSLLAAARSPPPRRPPIPSRLSHPSPSVSRRRLSSAPSRSLAELGCVQLLLPLRVVAISPCLTSHLSASVRACCELSQGT
ncbi:thylakoidal processing [Musa troglodytarum]|uniref:Thylakoidal processing n=1 Tax=Musa troglodytarum TaxID=320322 RepID=A0A9E7GP05_9LILI|nr:thylakoidal processing [Musa troglodytarum]